MRWSQVPLRVPFPQDGVIFGGKWQGIFAVIWHGPALTGEVCDWERYLALGHFIWPLREHPQRRCCDEPSRHSGNLVTVVGTMRERGFGHRADQDTSENDPTVPRCQFQQASPVSSNNLVHGTQTARSSRLPSSIYRVTAHVTTSHRWRLPETSGGSVGTCRSDRRIWTKRPSRAGRFRHLQLVIHANAEVVAAITRHVKLGVTGAHDLCRTVDAGGELLGQRDEQLSEVRVVL
jgi:hypothetical protein